MDLTLSDEQRLLRESADRFVNETYHAEHRRRIANEPLGFSAAIWKQFADLGWLALPIGEEYGGLGGGAIEIGILMEAFGRGLGSESFRGATKSRALMAQLDIREPITTIGSMDSGPVTSGPQLRTEGASGNDEDLLGFDVKPPLAGGRRSHPP
jgi:hypothetical protein